MAIANVNPEWLEQKKGQPPITKVDWLPRKTLDIPYGTDDLQRLDIYLPTESAEVSPVLVNIHGGGFTLCDKRDFHLYPTLFALECGYAVVAVNYRLSPAVRYPEHIKDVLTALKWIGQEGAKRHLDTNNVFLWGTSAGGNIVLQIGCKEGILPRQDSCQLRGIAALCPAINFEELGGSKSLVERLMAKHLERVMLKGALGTTKPTQQMLDQGNVHCHLAGGITPVYLQHGTRDPAIPYKAAQRLAAKLQQILPPEDFVFDTLEGAGHAGGGPDFFQRENVDPIVDFFNRHLAEN